MVYQNQFVAEIKYNGKILRMKDGFVSLPFGSEYSLLLKNLSSRNALVNISIDGQDVLDNSSIIINANTENELRGFLKGNVATNSFKFIKKTEEIQNHRGDRIDDGIVRIEYAFEKDVPKVDLLLEKKDIEHHHHHYHHRHYHWNYDNWFTGDSGKYYSTLNNSDGVSSRGIFNDQNVVSSNYVYHTPQQDEGITVKGSQISQHFNFASIGETDPSQVIIIRLRGVNSYGTPLQTPLTVKDKIQCSSCGRKSKSSFKYCPNCGTFLE